MGGTLAGVHSPDRRPDPILTNEIRERDRDLGCEERGEKNGPGAMPGNPGERSEENKINEVAPSVKSKLGSRRSTPTRKPSSPLMVVESIERSKNTQ